MEDNGVEPKRYKLCLDPNYSNQNVSQQTHNIWSKRCKNWKPLDQQLRNSGVAISPIANLEPEIKEHLSEFSQEENVVSLEPQELVNEKEDTDADGEITLSKFEEDNIRFDDCSLLEFESSDQDDDCSENSEFVEAEDTGNEEIHDTVNEPLLIGNRVMFQQSNMTIEDVLEMIMGFSTRYSISLEGRSKLFDMFKICAGPDFDNVNVSNYMMSKAFDPPKDIIKIHYYCVNCEELLLVTQRSSFVKENKKEVLCDKCSQQYELTLNSPNSFQVLNLKYQIDQLLKNPIVVKHFVNKIKNRTTDNVRGEKSISDVDDIILYREFVKKHPNAITFTFSTDGAAAKNPLKCKTKFWPIQLLFNELPISMRFKFVLLNAAMVVQQEPSSKLLNLFLKSFIDQALELSESDIPVIHDGKTYRLKFILLFCALDSVARALVQCRIQYNGYFGCSFCYIHGFYACGAVRYPFEEKISELRSSESHKCDLKTVSESSCLIRSRGVKGESVLCSLTDFDMIWGFCFDYLHTALLGPVEDITRSSFFSKEIIKKLD
ncbi:uncharacterized protein LOC122506101 [Leptopilina heterotoma]|uniref:uncharacterized protein LOC122506101 n=1 Tax=Leptopilina heterotoma TaxID=63436 RepID=UPI001CA8FC04|nr:uncharacterized protein LOC122506101 [Leptopilina heterotoma]